MITKQYTPQQDSQITIDLLSGLYDAEDSQELQERLRSETNLRVDGGLFTFYSEGSPVIPDVVVQILYTLFPLQDVYTNLLAAMIWDKVKAVSTGIRRGGTKVSFVFEKVDEDGRSLKRVMGQTDNPELIKDMIRRASEGGENDYTHIPY